MSAITKIKTNSFAAACYDNNTIEELCAIVGCNPDREDMNVWGLTESEWREQIELAIAALEEKAAE